MLSPFLIFGLGLVPSLIWLIFYLQEDYKHPEPLHMILFALFTGGIAAFGALILQVGVRSGFSALGVAAHSVAELTAFAAIEEIIKFATVYFLISKRPDFNEPLDAMIYMITVALGFAAMENIASLGQFNNGARLTLGLPIELLILRFFGATVLHSVTSGIVGYHWGEAMVERRRIALPITLGLIAAILLHSFFNYLILTTGPASWGITFAAFIAFFLLYDFEKLKAVDV